MLKVTCKSKSDCVTFLVSLTYKDVLLIFCFHIIIFFTLERSFFTCLENTVDFKELVMWLLFKVF